MPVINIKPFALKKEKSKPIKSVIPIERIGDVKHENVVPPQIPSTRISFARTEQLSQPKPHPKPAPIPRTKINRNKNFEPLITHSEWLQSRSSPKPSHTCSETIDRGKSQTLNQLNPRLSILSEPRWSRPKYVPPSPIETWITQAYFERQSVQQIPIKALKYKASRRIKKLAKPVKYPVKDETKIETQEEKTKISRTKVEQKKFNERLSELSMPRKSLTASDESGKKKSKSLKKLSKRMSELSKPLVRKLTWRISKRIIMKRMENPIDTDNYDVATEYTDDSDES